MHHGKNPISIGIPLLFGTRLPVILFQPMYRLGHPNTTYFISKILIIGSKYSKSIEYNCENRVTAINSMIVISSRAVFFFAETIYSILS